MREPLFVVGVGRSGTTWVQRAFVRSRSFATLTVAQDRFGLHLGRAISTLISGLRTPAEGYRLWSRTCPSLLVPTRRESGWQLPADEAGAFRSAVTALGRRARPVVKCTAFTRHISTIADVFPEARFLCIWRDPAAVAASLVNVGFWPALRLWHHDGRMPLEFGPELHLSLARELWTEEATALLAGTQALRSSRCQHIVYEVLQQHPSVLESALGALEFSTKELRSVALPDPRPGAVEGRLRWWDEISLLDLAGCERNLTFLGQPDERL